MEFVGFDWDDGNWPKCGKHGVSREEIEAAFSRSDFEYYPAVAPDQIEKRWIAIGPSPNSGRWLFVVFALREIRGVTKARPLSARFMHDKEIRRYASDNQHE